jgi:chromosome segregation ATPase
MTEDPTQKLPNSPSFEERVLAELAAIRGGIAKLDARVSTLETRMTALEDRMTNFETRLTALEDKVDARLRETRPIWESVQQQLTELKAQVAAVETRMGAMEKTLDDIRLRLTEVYRDSFEIRGRIGRLEERERERLSTG